MENFGGRGVRMKKRGSNMCGGLSDLNDLLIFLTRVTTVPSCFRVTPSHRPSGDRDRDETAAYQMTS